MTPVPLRKKLTRKTLIQSLAIGLIGGPLVWLFKEDHSAGNLVWCVCMMAAAPPLVDLIRPTYYRN